jgi:hypothetical protein
MALATSIAQTAAYSKSCFKIVRSMFTLTSAKAESADAP